MSEIADCRLQLPTVLAWEKMHFWPTRGQAEVALNEAEYWPQGGDWTLLYLQTPGVCELLVLKCRSLHFPGVS